MITTTGPLAWAFRTLVGFALGWAVMVIILGLSGVYGISLNGWGPETQRSFTSAYNAVMIIWLIALTVIYFLRRRIFKDRP